MYRVQQFLPLNTILTQLNPVHIITPYLSFILILSSHLRLGIPNFPFPSRFRAEIIYVLVVLFDVITLVILVDD
jgi:hypothetical protein